MSDQSHTDDDTDLIPISIGSHVRFFSGPTMIVTSLDPENDQILCAWWRDRELHSATFPAGLCVHALALDSSFDEEYKFIIGSSESEVCDTEVEEE